MSPALEALWKEVATALACMRNDRGELYVITTDDDNMRDAGQADLFGWVDDCEARLGFDVGDLRHAVVDYALARDGVDHHDTGPTLQERDEEARRQLRGERPRLSMYDPN